MKIDKVFEYADMPSLNFLQDEDATVNAYYANETGLFLKTDTIKSGKWDTLALKDKGKVVPDKTVLSLNSDNITSIAKCLIWTDGKEIKMAKYPDKFPADYGLVYERLFYATDTKILYMNINMTWLPILKNNIETNDEAKFDLSFKPNSNLERLFFSGESNALYINIEDAWVPIYKIKSKTPMLKGINTELTDVERLYYATDTKKLYMNINNIWINISENSYEEPQKPEMPINILFNGKDNSRVTGGWSENKSPSPHVQDPSWGKIENDYINVIATNDYVMHAGGVEFKTTNSIDFASIKSVTIDYEVRKTDDYTRSLFFIDATKKHFFGSASSKQNIPRRTDTFDLSNVNDSGKFVVYASACGYSEVYTDIKVYSITLNYK